MSAAKTGWEHFEHVADIGVHGFGPSVEDAFEQAALAMTAVAVEPENVRPIETLEIRCEAPDLEILLADWLNALVFEASTRGMLFGEFEVEIGSGAVKGYGLKAKVRGEAISPRHHRPAAEVKGATLTGLEVRQSADGLWHARCVVDV